MFSSSLVVCKSRMDGSKPAPSVEACNIVNDLFANEFVFQNAHDEIRTAYGILTARTSTEYAPSDHVSYLCKHYVKKYGKRRELLDRLDGEGKHADYHWSMKVRRFLEEPFSSLPATIFYIFLTSCVVVSCVLVVVQTTPQYNPTLFPEMHTAWFTTEIVLSSLFCVEWILRCVAVTLCPGRKRSDNLRRFLKKWGNNMDFAAAVVPTIMQFYGREYSFLNFFRLLRVFRVFLALRRYEMFEELEVTLRRSIVSLLGPLIGLIVVLCFFASLMYAMEMGSYDETTHQHLVRNEDCELSSLYALGRVTYCDRSESKFISILHSVWFVLATITTVGYGDMIPLTMNGRLVAIVTIIFGNVFMAMPIAIVGTTFTYVVDRLREERRLAGLYHQRMKARDLDYETVVLHELCSPAPLPSIAFFRFLRVALKKDILDLRNLAKRTPLYVDLFLQRVSDQFTDPKQPQKIAFLQKRTTIQKQPFSARLNLIHPRVEYVLPLRRSLNLHVGTSSDAHLQMFGPEVLRAILDHGLSIKKFVEKNQLVAPHQGNVQLIGYGGNVERIFVEPIAPFLTLLGDEIIRNRVQLHPGSVLRFDCTKKYAKDDCAKVTIRFGYNFSVFHHDEDKNA